MRTIVNQRLLRQKISSLRAFGSAMRSQRNTLLQQANEVWNVVRCNLEGAVAEVEERVLRPEDGEGNANAWSKSREMALGGLKRAALRLDDALKSLAEFDADIEPTFREKHQPLLAGIKTDVAASKTFVGRARIRIRALMQRIQGTVRAWSGALIKGGKHGIELADRAQTRLSEESASIRSLLGLSVAAQSMDLETTDEMLIETALRRQASLPGVYRRLFSFEPLELDQFLVGRDDAFPRIADAMNRWQRGQNSCLLIHGEYGCGKTSLLNCVEDKFFSETPLAASPSIKN